MDSLIIKDNKYRIALVMWMGLLVYNTGMLFSLFDTDFSRSLLMALLGLGIVAVCGSFLFLFTFRFKDHDMYIRVMVLLTTLWSVLSLLHSGGSSSFSIGDLITPYTVLPYITVVMIFFPVKQLLRSFISLCYRINWLFLLLGIIPIVGNVNNTFVQMLLETFAVGGAFIFITNKFHSMKQIGLGALVVLVAGLAATFMARRNLMATFGLYFLIGAANYVINGKLKSAESKIMTVLFAFLMLLGAVAYYMAESYGTFSKITGRASDNTREEVFLAFALDMGNTQDIAVGRGFFGSYYCPGVDREDGSDDYNDYRKDIECGYLQFILKGGLPFLLLYLMILVPAARRGFKSKNQMAKACAWIVVVQLFDMIAFGLPTFNTKTFMIWMAIAVCYNKEICGMSDDDISNMLFEKKRKLLPWETK